MMNFFGNGNFGFGFGNPPAASAVFTKKYACHSVAFHNADLEDGGKIVLPASALDELSSLRVKYPMLFQISNPSFPEGKKTHVGVMEFTANEGQCYVPYWIMQHLLIEEGGLITVRNVSLQEGNFVRLQPQTSTFLDISNPRAVLEKKLRTFSALTQGDEILIRYNNRDYYLNVIEVKPLTPTKGIQIVEADISVDFAPPLDYKEPVRQQTENSAPVSVPSSTTSTTSMSSTPKSPTTTGTSVGKPGSLGTSPPVSFPGQGYTLKGSKGTPNKQTTTSNNNNSKKKEEEFDSDSDDEDKKSKKFKAFSGAGNTLK